MTLRKILITLSLVLSLAIHASGTTLGNEALSYKVMFKWGLIQKQAGRGILYLRDDGNRFVSTLYARSEPWADRFYKVRDTLTTIMSKPDMLPVKYERIAHEGGKYSHDIVNFTKKGNLVLGDCHRYRRGKKDTQTTYANMALQAEGVTVDMLSSFYYLRTLDFKSLEPGSQKTINIFSGKRKELLKITYNGVTSLKFDKKKYNAYYVTFTFTSDGKKETSDPIQAWISADSRLIPLKLIGKLKVGSIQIYYTGK